ncbi:hypothetical protein C8J56DRAFT_895195 [Mycena floridula]|nr:hypothetical protein C8J56DRAFT_895195 [Mycena floridula]
MMKIHIFVIGATDYIGGSVLSRLLDHKNHAHFNITALVRSGDEALKLTNATGINVVVGSHQDLELVQDLSSKADVIFSLADPDNLELVKAQLKGSEKRYAVTGTPPLLIHISGVAFLDDDSFGMYGPTDLINDTDTAKIEAIPLTALHRNVDVELVQADQQGYVKTHIVVPGFIYGVATGKVAESGIQNTRNTIGVGFFSFAFERGEAGMLGDGKNECSHVEISEISNLVVLIYDSATMRPSETSHGREGFYFAENGSSSLYDINQVVQNVLIKTGRAKTTSQVPTTLSKEDISKYLPFPSIFLRAIGSNTACKSPRSRSLGWNPVKSHNEFLESFRKDIELMASAFP